MGAENPNGQDLLLTVRGPQGTQARGERHEQLPEMVKDDWDEGEEAAFSSLERNGQKLLVPLLTLGDLCFSSHWHWMAMHNYVSGAGSRTSQNEWDGVESNNLAIGLSLGFPKLRSLKKGLGSSLFGRDPRKRGEGDREGGSVIVSCLPHGQVGSILLSTCQDSPSGGEAGGFVHWLPTPLVEGCPCGC